MRRSVVSISALGLLAACGTASGQCVLGVWEVNQHNQSWEYSLQFLRAGANYVATPTTLTGQVWASTDGLHTGQNLPVSSPPQCARSSAELGGFGTAASKTLPTPGTSAWNAAIYLPTDLTSPPDPSLGLGQSISSLAFQTGPDAGASLLFYNEVSRHITAKFDGADLINGPYTDIRQGLASQWGTANYTFLGGEGECELLLTDEIEVNANSAYVYPNPESGQPDGWKVNSAPSLIAYPDIYPPKATTGTTSHLRVRVTATRTDSTVATYVRTAYLAVSGGAVFRSAGFLSLTTHNPTLSDILVANGDRVQTAKQVALSDNDQTESTSLGHVEHLSIDIISDSLHYGADDIDPRFGDLNRDGQHTLPDRGKLAGLAAQIIDVTSDPNALFDLRADLNNDGLINSTDLALYDDAHCPADYNQDGIGSIDDWFLFYNDWYMGDSKADTNGNGYVGIDDLYLFQTLHNAGC